LSEGNRPITLDSLGAAKASASAAATAASQARVWIQMVFMGRLLRQPIDD
jgi:hypothetical protein